MLPIGQMLLIGRMLLILPAPAVGAAPHDKGCVQQASRPAALELLLGSCSSFFSFYAKQEGIPPLFYYKAENETRIQQLVCRVTGRIVRPHIIC
jgi:hypothetical protein